MALETSSISRFSQTEAVIVDGIETFGRWKMPDFLDRDNISKDDIIRFSVGQDIAGRPDVIAFRQYGSQLLDWVVVMFNKPKNTLGWPPAGAIIEIPSAIIVSLNT